ncbi:MAG TPA: 16S rRNA (cytosine(967)-C(5))-methyltransferase RsmB [Candidatus Acidoferrales bacterium]|jgi:16S rRNA (cytosine967-C5)-methyltransferase|nr:16S rRNA (cytosine(967)-C(5))-methyltransferase RsmB [Candidatus Acidoferrales bacterium]
MALARRRRTEQPSTGISPARKIAYNVLQRVESEGAYASDLLHSELGAKIKPADAALATELTLGVLRHRLLLDFLLERRLERPIDRLDLPVVLALRLGAYQLRFLRRIPPSAAVNESVELVKKARKASAASLVNAVLRRIAEQTKSPVEDFLPADISPAQRLAILHSHPAWMVERWLARMDESRVIALLEANNHAPRLSCAVSDPAERRQVVAALEQAGFQVEDGALLRDAIALHGGSVSRTPEFRAGRISIQDEASQAIPLLLGARPGDRVLDVCAAPGGKTAPLARAVQGGLVIAGDRYGHRLRALKAQFERLEISNVRLVQLDATQNLPFGPRFDRILLDAPCSGTGTLARHPEIRWRLRPEQITELRALQVRMLRVSLAQLASGGRLVYSTCSIEPEENEDVIAEVLRATEGVRRVAPAEMAGTLAPYLVPEIPPAALFDDSGEFHTLPGQQQSDGFFAAALEI